MIKDLLVKLIDLIKKLKIYLRKYSSFLFLKKYCYLFFFLKKLYSENSGFLGLLKILGKLIIKKIIKFSDFLK